MSCDVQALLPSVQTSEPWLSQFTAAAYPAAFAAYKAQYAPLYAEALAQSAPQPLAEALLNALPTGRGSDPLSLRMMLTFYTTPLLLDMDAPAPELADALCRLWAQQRPREAYTAAPFEQLCQGFRRKIFGFDLGCASPTDGAKKRFFR